MTKLSLDVILGRQALRQDEPWIVPEAFEYLKDIVKLNWHVFEWGSGGSTIWFAQRCREVVSIEYRRKWKRRAERKIARLNLVHQAMVILASGDEYINAIDDEDFGKWDLIFIDGERKHRKRCIEKAMTKLAPGGYIMVDNSNWQALVEPLRDWQSVTFKAEPFMYKGKRHEWWTSFYWRPE
jgi:predicted O-methyltransferase YrrM